MSIIFKHPKDGSRYLALHPLALIILYTMQRYALEKKLPFVVTSTVTTIQEDVALNRKSSSHREFRAFDVSVKGWSAADIEEFVDDFNSSDIFRMFAAISASDGKPRLVVYHNGTAPHFHVQIHKRYAREEALTIEDIEKEIHKTPPLQAMLGEL